MEKFKNELDIEVVPFKMVSYLPDSDEYKPLDQIQPGETTWSISGTELRKRLKNGSDIPAWFTYPEVLQVLRQVYPPRSKQGFTVTIVGYYSSQLLTLANALESVLNQSGQRSTVLLVPNGEITKALTSDEVDKYAFTASQVAKCGGAVISVPITGSESDLQKYHNTVSQVGGSVVVHLSTSLQDCKSNDRIGFYQQNDYEFKAPKFATITADPTKVGISQLIHEITLVLEGDGYIGSK